MTPSLYYLIAAMLFGISLFLLKRRTPFASRRKTSYVSRRHSIRLLGVLLLFPAGLALTLGIILRYNIDRLPQTAVQSTSENFVLPTPKQAKRTEQFPQAPTFDPLAQAKKNQAYEITLAKWNEKLKANPEDYIALGNRGNAYAAMQQWKRAENDYRHVLQLNPKVLKASFNLAEMEFRQKNYDGAREGFLTLKSDVNLGDLAAYKVFLCDLLSGHQTVADKELDAFNQVGTEASYYFANIAWFVYHGKIDTARDWLKSATGIYEPYKVELYSSTLNDLGYLPLPPPEEDR